MSYYLPLVPGGKEPWVKKGRDWHDMISDDPAQHARWLAHGLNRGFPLEENGVSAVDLDDKEAAREFWRQHPEFCTYASETLRGIHLLFLGPTRSRNFKFGQIKGNGYLTWPPSVVKNWTYRFICQGELQPFPEHLFAEMEVTRPITRNVRSAFHYLMRIESIQGQDGSRGLVRACAVLRDGGYSELEAMTALVRWNQPPQVIPPWSPEELERAIKNTYRKGSNVRNQ